MVKRIILAWGEKFDFLLSVYSGSTKIILTALIASFGSIYSSGYTFDSIEASGISAFSEDNFYEDIFLVDIFIYFLWQL